MLTAQDHRPIFCMPLRGPLAPPRDPQGHPWGPSATPMVIMARGEGWPGHRWATRGPCLAKGDGGWRKGVGVGCFRGVWEREGEKTGVGVQCFNFLENVVN